MIHNELVNEQFSVPQIEYSLEGTYVYFLLIVAMVLLL